MQTKTSSKHLVLASSSPRRQELLATLGISFRIQASSVEESVPATLSPADIVETLALRKAQAVANSLIDDRSESIVIGSDTIVVLHGEVLGKPRDKDDAVRMLSALQGTTHEVFSGIAIIDSANGQKIVNHRCTKVTMKQLSLEQIERYIATGEPDDKAGAYAIQGIGATIVEGIEGDYFNVVGLSLSLLSDMLRDMGVEVL